MPERNSKLPSPIKISEDLYAGWRSFTLAAAVELERYDLVILGHILHGQSREWARRLIEKAAGALRGRGMMLIGEFIPNDRRTGPAVPLLFGLNMLVNAPEGDVYTMAEYRTWLKAAGMRSLKTIRAPQASPLILATK
ncbi:MAG: methyltransferase [Candidatus Binataceae bacterium]